MLKLMRKDESSNLNHNNIICHIDISHWSVCCDISTICKCCNHADNVTLLTIQKNAPKTIHLLFFLFLKTNIKNTFVSVFHPLTSTCNLLAYHRSTI